MRVIRDKIFLLISCLLISYSYCTAQTFTTLKGQVSFSSAAEETIDANNYSVAAQLIYTTGKGQFIIPVKSFRFKNALMEEHFNENYMESDSYPKATYKYIVDNIEQIDLSKPGKYNVNTKGVLAIKNVSRNIEVKGYIIVTDNNTIRIEANFLLNPSDYDIQIPKLVENKIAKNIAVKVYSTLNKQ